LGNHQDRPNSLDGATPVRLGQEFSVMRSKSAYAKERAEKAIEVLRELALGGTAVGTGLNRHVDLPGKVMRHLEQRTGIAFYEAKIISRRKVEKMRWSKPVASSKRSRSVCSKSPTTFAGSGAARAAASARFNCRPRNRAARSCRVK